LPDTWNEGYLINLSWCADKGFSWRLIPYELNRVSGLPRLLSDDKAETVRKCLHEMSLVLSDPGQLEAAWNSKVRKDEGVFLAVLAGGNRYIQGLNRRWPVIKKWYTPSKRKLLLNMIRCEAFREAYLSILDR
jgi:hypothetical protein